MRTLPNFLVVVMALLVSLPAGAADDAGESDAEILGFADAAVLGQARGGDAVAQFLIAKAFSDVRADAEKSIYWARLAADQGLSMAQPHLGKFYEMGVGVERDYARAAGLFRKAADQGDPVSGRCALPACTWPVTACRRTTPWRRRCFARPPTRTCRRRRTTMPTA
jgi:hypothetical protein